MEKPVAVLHWLLLTLGLAAAQAGRLQPLHILEKNNHQAFKVRFSIVLGILTYSFIVSLLEKAEQTLPNWLTGIIAVAVFLFLIFITFLVNKAWCETPR